MSSGVKLQLAQAERLARHLVEELAPACARVEIAGSIRRRRPEVGDIELVAIPTVEPIGTDLFGEPIEGRPLDAVLLALIEDKRLEMVKGFAVGLGWRFAQFRLPPASGGMAVDLFLAAPETWGSIFTIRTGPADFSRRLVTDRQHGGLCPSHLRFKDGRIESRTSGKVLDTPEEKDVFEACCLKWIKPEDRK